MRRLTLTIWLSELLMMVFANLLFPFFLVFSPFVFLAKPELAGRHCAKRHGDDLHRHVRRHPAGRKKRAHLLAARVLYAKSDLENVKNPPPLPPADPATEEPTAAHLESG